MAMMVEIYDMKPNQAQGSFPTHIGKMFVEYFDAKWGDGSDITILLVVFDLLQLVSKKNSL